jgi:hypothetical protein
MKRKFVVVLLLCILLFTRRQSADSSMYEKTPLPSAAIEVNQTGASYEQNDLVYRNYGKGIKLSMNSVLRLHQPYLEGEEDAVIYAVNLENYERLRLCDYHSKQVIIYTPASDGIYIIIAETGSGEIIDLTSEAVVETGFTTETSGGFLLLNEGVNFSVSEGEIK